jgi:hypothetical protein
MAGLDFSVLWISRRRWLQIVCDFFEVAVEGATGLPTKRTACMSPLERTR